MPLKIMVADDDPVSLKAIRSLTVSSGHTVLTFDDLDQAAERAAQHRFDVVFLGMRLPELAGLKLARTVRSSPANSDTPIVMLNATDDIESLRKAFAEGADFVLTKPVSAGSLLPMLAAMESPGWNGKRQAARLPLFTEVICTKGDHELHLRCLNISSSGMLLHAGVDLEVGQDVSLDFDLAEVEASLNVDARVARLEGNERVGIAFVDLAPEALNAIQLYVMGRLGNRPVSSDAHGSTAQWTGRGILGER